MHRNHLDGDSGQPYQRAGIYVPFGAMGVAGGEVYKLLWPPAPPFTFRFGGQMYSGRVRTDTHT